jgi:hypothetical protein
MFIFTKVAHSKFVEMHGDTSDYYQSASKSDWYFFYLELRSIYRTVYMPTDSARFTYRLNRLKPRASKFRGPPAKVYIIFNIVIGFSHLCCHNVIVLFKQPFSNFPYTVALHFRILQNFKHSSSSLPY